MATDGFRCYHFHMVSSFFSSYRHIYFAALSDIFLFFFFFAASSLPTMSSWCALHYRKVVASGAQTDGEAGVACTIDKNYLVHRLWRWSGNTVRESILL